MSWDETRLVHAFGQRLLGGRWRGKSLGIRPRKMPGAGWLLGGLCVRPRAGCPGWWPRRDCPANCPGSSTHAAITPSACPASAHHSLIQKGTTKVQLAHTFTLTRERCLSHFTVPLWAAVFQLQLLALRSRPFHCHSLTVDTLPSCPHQPSMPTATSRRPRGRDGARCRVDSPHPPPPPAGRGAVTRARALGLARLSRSSLVTR